MEGETMVDSNNNYQNSIPAGYRFCPDDRQLVAHYLQTKVAGGYILPGLFHEVNFYNHTPQELYDKYKREGQESIYFFSPRNKRYPKGNRPDRRVRIAPNESIPDGKVGFWKATGNEQSVSFKGIEVGTRRSLTYFEGTKVNGKKTNWLMQEFMLSNAPWNNAAAANEETMLLDDCVLYKLYYNRRKAARKQKKAKHGDQRQEVQNSNMPQASQPMNENGESAAYPSLMPPNDINAQGPLVQVAAATTTPNHIGFVHDQYDALMSRRTNLPNVGALCYWDGNFMQPAFTPAMQQLQGDGFTMNIADMQHDNPMHFMQNDLMPSSSSSSMQVEAEINYSSLFPFSVPPSCQPSSGQRVASGSTTTDTEF